MLTNVIDRRANPYAWGAVDVALEPTRQDNSVEGADQADPPPEDWSYDQLLGVSLADAVRHAQEKSGPTTLYVYDAGRLER